MQEIVIKIDTDALTRAIKDLTEAVKAHTQQSLSGASSVASDAQVEDSGQQQEQQDREIEKPCITIETVRSAFVQYAKSKGKDQAKAVLAKFNAAKVTELKEDDYSGVMKILEG